MRQEEPDRFIQRLIGKHGLGVVCLQERLQALKADTAERASWFQDDVHLTPAGHAVWGRLIREDLRNVLPAVQNPPASSGSSGFMKN